jgi:hypothetical protein
MAISQSTISSNFASDQQQGGGISNFGTMSVTQSTITANTYGGGLYNAESLSLSDSTVSDNAVYPYPLDNGISNDGVLTVTRSTLNGNGAAGLSTGGSAQIINSTITGNGFSGIYASGGTVDLRNSTISGNGNSFASGGIDAQGGQMQLANTILAGNSSGTGAPDCQGTLASAGYNLIGSLAGCALTPAATDRVGVTPQLGPLQNNGGPTLTMASLPSSPAIDGGNPAGCTDPQGNLLTTDQRGYSRPFPPGGICDTGAYEYGASSPTPSTPTPLPSNTPTATDTVVCEILVRLAWKAGAWACGCYHGVGWRTSVSTQQSWAEVLWSSACWLSSCPCSLICSPAVGAPSRRRSWKSSCCGSNCASYNAPRPTRLARPAGRNSRWRS